MKSLRSLGRPATQCRDSWALANGLAARESIDREPRPKSLGLESRGASAGDLGAPATLGQCCATIECRLPAGLRLRSGPEASRVESDGKESWPGGRRERRNWWPARWLEARGRRRPAGGVSTKSSPNILISGPARPRLARVAPPDPRRAPIRAADMHWAGSSGPEWESRRRAGRMLVPVSGGARQSIIMLLCSA